MTEKKSYTIELTDYEILYLQEIIEISYSQGYPPLTSICEQLENIKKQAFV